MLTVIRKTFDDEEAIKAEKYEVFYKCQARLKELNKEGFKFNKAWLTGDCFGDAYVLKFSSLDGNIEFKVRINYNIQEVKEY